MFGIIFSPSSEAKRWDEDILVLRRERLKKEHVKSEIGFNNIEIHSIEHLVVNKLLFT